jgi:DNA-binding transcriptional LysR family regulator
MELRHVRVFVTLAEELHFGRTAARLHLTQSSISGQLRQLENQLGVQLVHRNARVVSLTEVGTAFLRDARRLLAQAEAAAGGVQRFRDGTESIRVGYLHDAVPKRLPLALRRLSHEFPATRILLNTGSPQELLEGLRDELLDLAFVSLPAPVSGLHVTPLGFEHAVAAVPASLDRDDMSPLELLAERTMLTLPRRLNPAFYDALVAGLQSVGLPGSLVEIDATSVEPLLMEAACGAGCALLPESVMLRQRPLGVSFRRIVSPTRVGCPMAAVTLDAQWDQRLSALIADLSQPVRELTMAAPARAAA